MPSTDYPIPKNIPSPTGFKTTDSHSNILDSIDSPRTSWLPISLQQRLIFDKKNTPVFTNNSRQHSRNKYGTSQVLPQTTYFRIFQRSTEERAKFSKLTKLKRNLKSSRLVSRNETMSAWLPLHIVLTNIQDGDNTCCDLVHNNVNSPRVVPFFTEKELNEIMNIVDTSINILLLLLC